MHNSAGEGERIAFHTDVLGAALHAHHDCLRAAELERANRLLGGGAPPDRVLEELARRLTNKFLHAPTVALNRAEEPERTGLAARMRAIYQLPEPH
jgi:glutamyl-tRNA reductase